KISSKERRHLSPFFLSIFPSCRFPATNMTFCLILLQYFLDFFRERLTYQGKSLGYILVHSTLADIINLGRLSDSRLSLNNVAGNVKHSTPNVIPHTRCPPALV